MPTIGGAPMLNVVPCSLRCKVCFPFVCARVRMRKQSKAFPSRVLVASTSPDLKAASIALNDKSLTIIKIKVEQGANIEANNSLRLKKGKTVNLGETSNLYQH